MVEPGVEPKVERRAAEVAEVYAHYRSHHPRCAPILPSSSKEYRLIAAALKRGHTIEALCRCIDGYHRSPHHLGQNDRGERYLALELMVRDESHIVAGIEMVDAGQGSGAGQSDRTRRSHDAARRFAEGGDPFRSALPPGGHP